MAKIKQKITKFLYIYIHIRIDNAWQLEEEIIHPYKSGSKQQEMMQNWIKDKQMLHSINARESHHLKLFAFTKTTKMKRKFRKLI